MVADAISSASITALDSLNSVSTGGPIAIPTSGEGSSGKTHDISDYVTPTAAGLADTGSKYKLVRVSPEIKLKDLKLAVTAAIETSTGLAFDVGAYYSDSTVDGTPSALQGTVISVNCFAAVVTGFRSSALGSVDVLTAFSVIKRNQRLWEALGLTSNPGGNIDVVLAVHTAATGAASVPIGVDGKFVP